MGGSFDPIHHGHLRLAQEAIERLDLEAVLMIPARPWQRGTRAGDAARLEMLRLACATNPRLQPLALELERSGPSYTVDTLRALRQQQGDARPLWLILGADAFLGLPSWHQWEALAGLCHLAVAPRPDNAVEAHLPAGLRDWWSRRSTTGIPAGPAGGLVLLASPELDISATAIRRLRGAGHSPRYLLPDPVLDYIESKGLYLQEGHGA